MTGPSADLSRRDRRKQETIDDIKAAARRQLASAGPAGFHAACLPLQAAGNRTLS